jgi:CDP-glycerol glycerophosphotransferase
MSTVAVVIPCFNVAPFLDDCLASVVGQTHRDLQIVLIDDGSTDGTSDIVDRWASADQRVVAVHQQNAGLGAARNAGVDVADADWLFFLDSDDLLPIDAIGRMVASGSASGSDIVSGVAERFNSTRRWRSGMYRNSFRTDVQGTHVFRRTDLLYDHIACSKLFRSSFWKDHAFRFPEGVRFEDIELVTRAHCLARSVDLIATATYLWRERDGTSVSITQDRTTPGSTAERFAALTRLDAYLAAEAPAHVWAAHAGKVFSLDVPTYCSLVPDADAEYLHEFVRSAHPLAAAASPVGVAGLAPLDRYLRDALVADDEASVLAIGRLLSGRQHRSAVRTLAASWSLPGLKGKRAAASEVRRSAGKLTRSATPHIKAAGVGAIRSAAVVYQAGMAAVRSGNEDAKLDLDLRRIASVDRNLRRVARRLLPRPPAAPPRAAARELDLVGGLSAHVVDDHGRSIAIEFREPPVEIAGLQLVHAQEKLTVPVPCTEGRYHLDVRELLRFGTVASFRPPSWQLVALDTADRAWAVLGAGGVVLEHDDEQAGAHYRVLSGPAGTSLQVGSLLALQERGPAAQAVLQADVRRRVRAGAQRDVVFYEAYYGRSVSCHPRAIYERLRTELPDWEHVFAVQPGFHRAATGAGSALRWSRRYHELLGTARIVVTNCELHPAYRRAPHQVIAQTWHGTPLKRIGLDIDSPRFRNASYQKNLAQQSRQWSFLVSPTPETDEIFPRAFAFEGPVLPAGSPRNDRLVASSDAEREQVRAAIGLEPGAIAVLFAPTFRDDAHASTGYRATPACDLSTLTAQLPAGAVVLFRAHSNIRASDIPWRDASVINVSDFPDMQDLILAADILVTDYSSTMFDWALTGRPLVLYAPDLAQYRATRDFYFDYEEAMPVRAASTPDELAEDLLKAASGHGVAYTDFSARFNGRDDGHATERVCEEILRRLG